MNLLFLVISLVTSPCIAQYETPANYTASDLRDRAKLKSFDSREGFERITNAKLNMRLKYLNLLPHFSFGSILGSATYSGALGILSSAGDLVPFLLPNRWFQARESKYLYQSEMIASELMQLNAMQIVETLSIAMGRDQFLHLQLENDLELINGIEQEILTLESSHHLPDGASLGVSSLHNGLSQIISSLESTIDFERTELAQAAGFTNPMAILNLQVIPLGNIQQPAIQNLEEIQGKVVKQSLELEQVNDLINAAHAQHKGRWFQWLDPSGDNQGGIGLGLADYIAIGSSNVREVELVHDRVLSGMLKNATDAYHNYLGWIDSYQLANQGMIIQQKRLEIAHGLINNTMGPYSLEYGLQEIKDAAYQLSINHINIINAEFAWYAVISQMNRMTLQGAYLPTTKLNEGI